MINITNNLNEMFELANVDNNDIDGGEDLEDGEIYDDEAEAEEKPEAANRLVEMEKAASAAPPEAQVPQPVAASAVVKSVLKNDALNMSDRHEKKIANFRWTDENSSKKEERNSGHLDADKRTKDKKLKRKKQKDDESENDGPAKFKGKTNVKKPFGEVSCELNHVHEEQYLCSPNLKKRKTSFERELEKLEDSDYIDEDDEEMLNIRGASPSRWMDIFSDEDDQSFEESEGGRGTAVRENVRGGAARRRGAGFRGGRIDRNARRERIERMSTRGGGGGKRRGKGAGMRGGKKGRVDEKEICIYHMQGKCHRGSECPFSHDAMPPRKMELCKFYLMDCCAKKDKCLYMHSEFPCKYFHTGLKCFAGKNCKFSHAKLTDSLRAILNKTYGPSGKATNEFTSKHQEETGFQRQHLETAPKEILGDFPRLREATRNLKKDKKIPSLFDIKVSPPRDMRSQSDSDGNHTPMPSPTHQPNNKDFFRESMERLKRFQVPLNSSSADVIDVIERNQLLTMSSMELESASVCKERTPPQVAAAGGERRRGGEGGHHHKSGDRKSHSQRKDKETRRQERQERSEQRAAARLERAAERFEEGGMGGGGGGGRSSRERRGDKGGGRRHSWEDAELQQLQHHDAASQRGGDGGRRQESYSPPPHNYEEEAPINERLKAPEPDQSGNDFLSHLPKKQRELFLRIQQQQRQAENSQESNAEDDDQDNDCSKHEENWYSSDEESTPLTTILKTINIQKTATTSMMGSQAQSLSPNQNHHQPRHHHHHHHHHNHHHHNQQQQSHTQVSDEHQQPSSTPPSSSSPALPVAIPDIDFGDVSALLSKVQQHIQTTADRLKVRDPRLRPDDPTEKQQQHLASDHDHAHAEAHAHSRSSSLSEPHAQSRAPTQLSPSISAILNAAGRHQPHHHHNPHHSSPPSSHQHSSRSSHSHHHHHHHNNHSGAFPPATPVLNFDGDDDGDDDNGILSPDSETDPSPDADSMSLSRLPFKPAPVHSAANEIDASINSHAPIVYRLVPIQPSKPDYSALQTMPKGGALDPRWRKAVRFSEESGLGSRRDPRHRLAAAAPDDNPRHPSAASSSTSSSSSSSSASHPPADPRQRIMSSMMNSNNSNSSLLPPSTPRYDDDHTPTGMRAPGGGFPAQMDVSAAMFCPPTPRLDDDQQPIMAANNPSAPLRPTDPRQRHHMMNQQQAMTSHGNVYDHMRQQQQQMYPMPPNQQSMMFDPNHRGMYGNDMSANMNRQPQYNNYK